MATALSLSFLHCRLRFALHSDLSSFPICHSVRGTMLYCSTSEKQSSVEKNLNATDLMTWDVKSAPKLDFDEDYYKVLEVDSNIAGKELKKAYYSIVFIYHPDRKSDVLEKELANKQMMVINGTSSIIHLCISITTNLTIYIFKRCMYFCPILSYPMWNVENSPLNTKSDDYKHTRRPKRRLCFYCFECEFNWAPSVT